MIPPWLNSDGDDDRDRRPVAKASGVDPAEGLDDDEAGEWVRDTDVFAEGQAMSAWPSDDGLASLVAEALQCDPHVYGRHLEILVQNRVAILIGELGSAESRAAAGRRAWTVPGVRDVCNLLKVADTAAGNW